MHINSGNAFTKFTFSLLVDVGIRYKVPAGEVLEHPGSASSRVLRVLEAGAQDQRGPLESTLHRRTYR